MLLLLANEAALATGIDYSWCWVRCLPQALAKTSFACVAYQILRYTT